MVAGIKRRYAMVRSPMMGAVSYIQCASGATVEAGATVLAIEAMKLVSSVTSPVRGEVEILVKVGEMVNTDQIVAKVYV